MILEGKLKPEDRLPPEFKLVERFGVSKVTLREALQTLETYGHITGNAGPAAGAWSSTLRRPWGSACSPTT